MLDRIRWYFAEIVVPKYIPVAIMAALSALGTFMVAHAGVLEKWGITYGTWPIIWGTAIPSGQVIVVELDTLSKGAAAALAALVGILIVAIQHHATGNTGVSGGRREQDPPAPKA